MTRRPLTRLAVMVAAALSAGLLAAAPAGASAGDLDTSFGTGGSVFSAPGTSNAATGVVQQSDGKLVTSGWAVVGGVSEFAVERHNADGSPDSSFGTGGTVTTSIGTGAAASKVVLQGDGKLVVAGSATVSGASQFAIARYNTNGTLDGTFGTGGVATTAVGTSDSANAVVVQTDGKIVVAGRATVTNHVFALARFDSNGTLDSGFGTGGKVTTVFGTDDTAYTLAVQPDDKLVAAGIAKVGGVDKIALARYGSDGTLDSGFGTGGKVTTDVGTGVGAFALLRQPDGKLVVAGGASSGTVQFALVRYNPDGSVDSGFGTGGTVLTAMSDSDIALGLVRQPDGKLVVDGMSYESATTTQKFGLARYNSDGSLDTGFGSGGKIVSAFGASDSSAFGLALQSDGGLVAAGLGYVSTTRNMLLVRYVGDPPDTSISSTPAASTTATDATFDFASTQAGSTFECQLDGGAWQSCSGPKAYTGLGLGGHTFSVRASYPAGNTDSSPAGYSWTVVMPPPPDTTITAAPDASTTATDATFGFTSTQTGSTFECQLDGGAWQSCSSPQAYTGLSVGSHTFAVRAAQPSGNPDATPDSRTWTVTDPAKPKPAAKPGTIKLSSIPREVTVDGKGNVPVTFTCGAKADCKGTVYLEMGVTGKKASVARRSRPKVVGRARFSVKAGKKVTLKLKLAGSAKRLLSTQGSLTANLKVTTVSGGKQLTASKKVKIKAKAARRSRPRRVSKKR